MRIGDGRWEQTNLDFDPSMSSQTIFNDLVRILKNKPQRSMAISEIPKEFSRCLVDVERWSLIFAGFFSQFQ